MLLRRAEADTRATRGFVLIEVLVAVGVAAILMAALLRSFSATWGGINIVREEAESMLLARTLLADGASPAKLVPGTQNGTLGRYAWSLTAIAAPVAAPPKPAPAAAKSAAGKNQNVDASDDQKEANPWILYRVDLVITTPSGRSKSLETFRLGQAAK